MSAVAPPQDLKLRVARFEDYPSIAALESSQGLASKPFEEWRHLWAGNPCYEELGPSWPIGWVLEDGDRIVGCLTNIPLTYSFRQRKILVASGRGWAVDDRYRGYALMLMNEYFCQENVDVLLTNTVNGNAAEAFSTFGSLRVPAGDWTAASFVVTKHVGFAESALRIKGVPVPKLLSYPAGVVLLIKDRFSAKAIPQSQIRIEHSHDFDERFSVFWTTLCQNSPNLLADRSRAVLEWHFGPSLNQDTLWVLTAAANGTLDAYAIFQRRDEPQYGLKRLRMVDFQAHANHGLYCTAFMRRAFDECRAQGIHVLEQVGCNLPKTLAFDRFAPYRRTLPSWSFFYSTANADLAHQLSDPEAWAPSSYDADASL